MGSSDSFTALAALAAASSVGIGGNIPVDSAVFLGASSFQLLGHLACCAETQQLCVDFLPSSHQYLLTILSIWWVIGLFLGSVVSPRLCFNAGLSILTPFNTLCR